MKQFLQNILILAVPLVIYLIIIVLIDPFNYMNVSKLVDDDMKSGISKEIAPHLYKLIAFENNPRKNITLGDSRTDGLYNAMDKEKWSNLAFGGGTLKEMIQAFWWAAEHQKLDTVLMNVSLNLYNKYNKRFYVEEAIEVQKNILSYAFNKNVFRSTFLIIKSYLSRQRISINEVSMTKEEFWQFQLNDTPEKFYSKLAYPDNYYSDLLKISEYCNENNITLIFWIPPTHIDFQNCLVKYNIDEARKKFKEDINSLGEVYDYNYVNDITMNEECFRDPLHFTRDVAIRIREELIEGKPFIAIHSFRSSAP